MKKIIIVIFCILVSIQSIFAFSLTGKGFFGIFGSIFGGEPATGCGPRKCGPSSCKECEYCQTEEVYIKKQKICVDAIYNPDTGKNECLEWETIGDEDILFFRCVPRPSCGCNSCPSGNCRCEMKYKKVKCVDKPTPVTGVTSVPTTQDSNNQNTNAIGNSKCSAGEICVIDINFECNSGLWILTNKKNNPLEFPITENIPPLTTQFIPKEPGIIFARALCFDPEIELLNQEIVIE